MEDIPLKTEVPNGALPGQFCVNNVVTTGNPRGTDCAIWIIEGMGDRCTFVSPEHAEQGVKFLGVDPGTDADGVCRDFARRDFGSDADWIYKPR